MSKQEEQEEQLTIERILIGLDTSHHSLAALRAAAELARNLGAELHGIFVEDVNLLRVAELRIAQELQFPFATHAKLNPGRMRRQLRAQAQQARQALSSICEEERIEWSFQVVRGDVSAAVLEEAAKADLLCVGRASRPVMHQPNMGSTAEAAATEAPRCVLLISRDKQIHAPIAVLYDASPSTEPSLQLAAKLAQGMGGLLSVLVPAAVLDASEQIQKRITEGLEVEGLVVRYRELTGSGVMSLINAIQTEGTGLLVLSRALLPLDNLKKLLSEVDAPVLLVR
jgi:nucleotide-binding universal stress UspA family protein